MAFVEDSTVFFADFAVQATIVLPADVAGRELTGIFDAAYLSVDAGSGEQSSAPVFTLPDSSIPTEIVAALREGDDVSIEIDGCTWFVVEPQPDGAGVTLWRLRK